MMTDLDINKIISDTIESICDDKDVLLLINKSIQYELDNWNRTQLKSRIEDDYLKIIESVSRGINDEI